MFWGCVSYSSTRNLVKIDGIMNAVGNQENFGGQFAFISPEAEHMRHLRHDNDAKHNAKSTI